MNQIFKFDSSNLWIIYVDSNMTKVIHSDNYHKIIANRTLETQFNDIDIRIDLTNSSMKSAEYAYIYQDCYFVVVDYTIRLMTNRYGDDEDVGIDIEDYEEFEIQSNIHDKQQILSLVKYAFTNSNEPDKIEILDQFDLHGPDDLTYTYVNTVPVIQTAKVLECPGESCCDDEKRGNYHKKGSLSITQSNHMWTLINGTLYHDFDGIEVEIDLDNSVYDVVEYLHIRNGSGLIVIDYIFRYAVLTCGATNWDPIGCYGYTICTNDKNLNLSLEQSLELPGFEERILIKAILENGSSRLCSVNDCPDISVKSMAYILAHNICTKDLTENSQECPF
jgi:hypothetical protein